MKSVKPFSGVEQFIPIPQIIVDELFPALSPVAWKVFTFVFRKTAGWRKARDSIAYSQIMRGTGIRSKSTVSEALHELQGEVPVKVGRAIRDWVRVPEMPVFIIAFPASAFQMEGLNQLLTPSIWTWKSHLVRKTYPVI